MKVIFRVSVITVVEASIEVDIIRVVDLMERALIEAVLEGTAVGEELEGVDGSGVSMEGMDIMEVVEIVGSVVDHHLSEVGEVDVDMMTGKVFSFFGEEEEEGRKIEINDGIRREWTKW